MIKVTNEYTGHFHVFASAPQGDVMAKLVEILEDTGMLKVEDWRISIEMVEYFNLTLQYHLLRDLTSVEATAMKMKYNIDNIITYIDKLVYQWAKDNSISIVKTKSYMEDYQ